MNKISFASDYMEGAYPSIIARLTETNLIKTPGYGTDDITGSAKARIRKACNAPDADVFFLVGGTQTNATVIDALLKMYQGVIAAESGHVSVHEAGAIEASGHKVLTLPNQNGKITAKQVQKYLDDFNNDGNHEHMVMPGMVYISHPTEYGTLYSLEELEALSKVCRSAGIPLYLDGARLAYALACPENDITLENLAELCDVFYIGGTKCGALFGEAVVIPKHGFISHFFTLIKQHGALLAKGRLLGLQFDELFSDDLYLHIGEPAIAAADKIRFTLRDKGFELCFGSPTNQIFCKIENSKLERLSELVEYSFWEKADDLHTIIRFATSWATTDKDTQALIEIINHL